MKTRRDATNDLPILLCTRQKDWAAWLSKNYARSPGVWLRIAKKGFELRSVSYDEALQIALCYGWIDGQKRSYDKSSWLQRFTKRGAKSVWSKINMAGYSLVKSFPAKLGTVYPDMPWEPKESFNAVAKYYANA